MANDHENEDSVTLTMAERIHTLETWLFWFERVLMLALFFFSIPQPSLLVSLTASQLLFLSLLRQFIRGFFSEPNRIFYIERVAILVALPHYVLPGGCVRCALIGLSVLVLTNYLWVKAYDGQGEQQLPTNNTTLDVKETGIDQEEEEENSGMEDELVEKKEHDNDKKEEAMAEDEDEGLKKQSKVKPEAKNSVQPLFTFHDLLGQRDNTLRSHEHDNDKKEEAMAEDEDEGLKEQSKVKPEGRNFVQPLFIFRDLLGQRDNTLRSHGHVTIEHDIDKKEEAMAEDEGLKEQSKVKPEARNSVQPLLTFRNLLGQRDNTQRLHGHVTMEHDIDKKEAEDEGLKEQSKVKPDAKNSVQPLFTFRDIFGQWDNTLRSHGHVRKKFADHGEEEVKAAADEFDTCEDSETAEYVEEEKSSVTDEFENIEDYMIKEEVACNEGPQEDRENSSASKEEKIKEVTAMADKVEKNEVEEARDDDDGWEEVENILDTACAHRNKTDEPKQAEEEEEEKEAEDSTDSDKSSWVDEGKSNASSSACESFQEQLHKWEQKKMELTQKLEVATTCLKQHEENYKLQKEILAHCTQTMHDVQSQWETERLNLSARLDAATDNLEKEFAQWNAEKVFLDSKLDLAIWSLEEERVKWKHLESEWDAEKHNLNAKLDAANKKVAHYQVIQKEVAEERRQWVVEKEYLRTKLATVKYANDELRESLNFIEEVFEEERQTWEKEKYALNAVINNADENVQYCQDLVNAYSQRCSMLEKQVNETQTMNTDYHDIWTAETGDLSSKLKAANSWRQLMEENLDLSTKLYAKSSVFEGYKRHVNELEDKCLRLEEENNDLASKLCDAKASSELYRDCLHDFDA